MYTGIVQAVRPVASARPYAGGTELTLDFTPDLLEDLRLGASVSVEGTCLSVTRIDGTEVSFDAMRATLDVTNLAAVAARGRANVERSAKPNDENGGHAMAGHIATTARITELDVTSPQAFLKFRIAPDWAKYVFPRGFLAVNGCSLTVASREDGGPEGDIFRINLIPETLRQTTFGLYRPGDLLNIEVDHQTMVLVDTVERTMTGLIPKLLDGRV